MGIGEISSVNYFQWSKWFYVMVHTPSSEGNNCADSKPS